MNSVRPAVKAHIIELAKKQPQYTPVLAAAVKHPGYPWVNLRTDDDQVIPFNTMLTAWQPDPKERARIAGGESLYLGVLTGGSPMQPVSLVVGPAAAAACYGVLRTGEGVRPPRTYINRCPKCPTSGIVEGHDMAWRCGTCGRVLTTEGVV
jgi:ribosomal protein S27AE